MIAFSSQDKEHLARWLTEGEFAEKAMPIQQLEGYVFALVCAPSPIIEEVWVAQVLGGDVTALADDKLFALMAFHNEISECVFDKGYCVSSRICVHQSADKNLSEKADIHLWSAGFALGVQHYKDAIINSDKLSDELHEALAMTLNYLCFFANLRNDKDHCAGVVDLLDDFSAGFASLIEACVIDAGLVEDEGFE